MNTVNIFDFDFISSDNLEKVVDDIFHNIRFDNSHLPLMVTPNVDQIVKLHKKENKHLSERLRNARYVLPDGQPIVTLSKLKFGKKGIRKRLTGADLFSVFWKRLRESEYKILLVVPSTEIGKRLETEYANAKSYCPPYFHKEDKNSRDLINQELL